MKVFAEIEKSFPIELPSVIHETAVWKYLLWIDTYEKKLPFMADQDTRYPRKNITLGSLFVDFVMYRRVSSLDDCFANAETFFINHNTLYVHFTDYRPAWVFIRIDSGIMYGFTNQEPEIYRNIERLPDLLDVLEIEQRSDTLHYERMAFNSGNVRFNNSMGYFDGILDVFGNNFNIFFQNINNEMELIKQFFISSYSINSREANFNLKDRRERLSSNAPNTYFDKELPEYRWLEDRHDGEIIQDAYGVCVGVPATCINGLQVYNTEAGSSSGELQWHSFKVARSISKISRVQVRMRNTEGNDLWVEVFPGFGVRGNTVALPDAARNPRSNIDTNFAYQNRNPEPIEIVGTDGTFTTITTNNMNNLPANNGVIRIWSYQAMRFNPGMPNGRGGEPQKVKVDGEFNGMTNPGDIVKDMIIHYTGLPNDSEKFFNMQEWRNTFQRLPAIGIVLNRKQSIYDYIENIQNGSLLGWQLIIDKNRYSARLDNPNRGETFNLTTNQIMNIHDVEVEMDGENYATYTEIKWGQDVHDDLWEVVIDKSAWEDIMTIYKFDQSFENNSLLTNANDAAVKGRVILDNFREVRPIIRGIELLGEEYYKLQLFDIGRIDFTIELPERLKRLQPFLNDRYFIGSLRCKIIGHNINLETGIVTIDVRQVSPTLNLPLEFMETPLHITGERSSTVLYDWNIPNITSRENNDEVNYIFNAGGSRR